MGWWVGKFFWTTDSMQPAVAVSVLLLVQVLPLEAATRLACTKFSAHQFRNIKQFIRASRNEY